MYYSDSPCSSSFRYLTMMHEAFQRSKENREKKKKKGTN